MYGVGYAPFVRFAWGCLAVCGVLLPGFSRVVDCAPYEGPNRPLASGRITQRALRRRFAGPKSRLILIPLPARARHAARGRGSRDGHVWGWVWAFGELRVKVLCVPCRSFCSASHEWCVV